MFFDEVKIGIQCGTITSPSSGINGVTESDCPFVLQPLAGPDLPLGLSGRKTGGDHFLDAPSAN